MKINSETVSVITGAGSGFGRALALELAKRGGSLFLADINLASVEETVQLAVGAQRATAMRCDVSKPEDIAALCAAVEGPIDLVVNNAGVACGGLIGETPLSDWHRVIDVDLWGVIYGCHTFAPRLRKQGRGHFLNVASTAGVAHLPGMAAYNVAKAGVIALCNTLAGELSGTGVGVTALCPTFFKTNIVRDATFMDDKSRARAASMIRNGKTAEQVARAALRAVQRNQRFCFPAADAQFAWRLERFLPGTIATIAGRVLARENRQ